MVQEVEEKLIESSSDYKVMRSIKRCQFEDPKKENMKDQVIAGYNLTVLRWRA